MGLNDGGKITDGIPPEEIRKILNEMFAPVIKVLKDIEVTNDTDTNSSSATRH